MVQPTTLPLHGGRATITSRRLVRPAAAAKTLRLYTKPSCPLCDGLQGKLEALKQRAQFMPTSPLADVTLQVCDISGDAGLEQRYGMLVPVLTWAADDADEVMIERPSPRVGAAQLERHLAKHIPQ